jgi:hypothetical protein
MVSFLVFIGFLAFISGYIVSLEERLQRDGKFCPFSVPANLRASLKARKFLTWLGMLIWLVTIAVYLFGPPEEVSAEDGLMHLAPVVIVFVFMLRGYARELELKKRGKSFDTYDYQHVIDSREWPLIVYKAVMDVAKILLFVIALYFLKVIKNSWLA